MAEKFPYLARQINGDIAKMFGYGIDHVYEKDQEFLDFISSFSIDELDGDWLDQLGAILGIARPQIDGSLYHKFLFYGPAKNPSAEVIAYMKAHGFSDKVNVADPDCGGLLDDVTGTEYAPIDDDIYKTYIKSCCALRNNHAFLNICAVVESIVGKEGYEVDFFEQGDTYGGELVASGDIHITLDKGMAVYEDTLSQLFEFVMTTNPRVFVGIGDDGYGGEDFIFYMLPDDPNDDQRRYAEVHGMSDRVNTSESGNGGLLGDTDSGDYDDGTVPYDPTEGNFVFFELPENPTQEQIEYAQAHGFSDGVNTSSEGYGGFLPDVARPEFDSGADKYDDMILFTAANVSDKAHGLSDNINTDNAWFGGLLATSDDADFQIKLKPRVRDTSIDWSETSGGFTLYALPDSLNAEETEWAKTHGFSDKVNTSKTGYGGFMEDAADSAFAGEDDYDAATAFTLTAGAEDDEARGFADAGNLSVGGELPDVSAHIFQQTDDALMFAFTQSVEDSGSGFSNWTNDGENWRGGFLSNNTDREFAPSVEPIIEVLEGERFVMADEATEDAERGFADGYGGEGGILEKYFYEY